MSAVHFLHDGILFLLLIYGTIASIKPVAGSSLALCEGGQTCLPPKECCAQGCCYLYAPPGAPRVPLATNDHMLSALFLNHWYFWCFVLAIVLALLCTCSLWRKRRQLCGWDTSARHSQSEGDSAGSCYAPPQYSRCNSFHIHAPPPYTEVASKPDLYPLVFSYTDPGKGNGANYLMVQYFRNYIVQPVGSISGTSTVDSLSSSFICNANEANTLVPPPYSRAASPDLTVSFRNYLMPRSASQQVCLTTSAAVALPSSRSHAAGGTYQARDGGGDDESLLEHQHHQNQHQRQHGEEEEDDEEEEEEQGEGEGEGEVQRSHANAASTTINHSNFSSNNVSLMECSGARSGNYHHPSLMSFVEHGPSSRQAHGEAGAAAVAAAAAAASLSTDSFPSQDTGSSGHPSGHHGRHTAGELCDVLAASRRGAHGYRDAGPVCKLCCSTGDLRPPHRKDLAALHKSLETCCHVTLHGAEAARPLANLAADSEDSVLVPRKGVSSAGSNVSSLVNLDSAGSPPRATSPTAEVRELLEQIRQLHHHEEHEESHQEQPPSVVCRALLAHSQQANGPGLSAYRRPASLIGRRRKLFSKASASSQLPQQHHQPPQHTKTMYIPISFTQNCMVPSASGTRHLRSPAAPSSSGGGGGASSFLNRGRSRYCWMSKSAPTTPGAAPGSFAGGTLGDSRPLLLHEQEEDGEQNV
uniref:WW domain binding protein VOPP1 n=1 Tax=Anopheles atroparvus TaxID=41427 RepID=A0AAG5DWK6_ANOAO